MLVVEFTVDTPILKEALTRAPDTVLTYEEQYQTTDGITLLFWAEAGDLSTFEEGLAADPTVRNVDCLTEMETRSLYRVTFTEYGEQFATFPAWSELDISFLNSTGTHEGWDIRMRMPDREALRRYRRACAESDLQFQLTSIYEGSETASDTEAQLTSAQREALLAAHESGYFEIPREASLAEVADRCDVSPQALSERLRRGTATLVRTTLLGTENINA